MTNKELDVIWQICAMIHDDKGLQECSYADLARWISRQLYQSLNITASPVGMCHLANSDEEYYRMFQDGKL